MVNNIIYPTAEKIIEYNLLTLKLIKVKKADRPKVLGHKKILEVIDECEQSRGDIYDKAVCLLKGLVQKHPFASGNRRTAFVVAKEFLLMNKTPFRIADDPTYARVMIGIRENFYKDYEIKEWLKHGKIKEFKREGAMQNCI